MLEFLDEEFDALETNVPNLWKKAVVAGAGHWIQQERPAEVNRLLIAFLKDIEAGARAQEAAAHSTVNFSFVSYFRSPTRSRTVTAMK